MPDQKHVLVSGAATGFGYLTALKLARQNFKVYAGVIAESYFAQFAAEPNITPLLLDITQPARIAAAVDRITTDTAGIGLHALVNVAAIAPNAAVELHEMSQIRRTFEVNVFGTLGLTKALLPLIRQASGRIVIVTSMAGKVALPMLGVYSSTKFALEGLGDALRMELRPWGIGVAMVEYGAVKTTMITESAVQISAVLETIELPEYQKLYRSMIKLLGKQMESKIGSTPDQAAEALAGIVTAVRLKPRYVVGTDAKTLLFLKWLLPDRLMDSIRLSQFTR